jgi:cytochrome P450
MHSYAEQMRAITEARVATWRTARPFAMHPEMQSITLDVILRAVFGLTEGAQMNDFAADLMALLHPPPAIVVFIPRLHQDAFWNPYRAFYRRREVVDRTIHAIIAERRGAPDLAQRTDILSLLLLARDEDGAPMTDEEVRDELLTMLAAGHETTATSLAWAFERILALPDVAAKVHSELRAVTGGGRVTPEMLPRLEYLDAVINETLRIRPILPIVIRRVKAPFRLGGYDLPLGSMVAPCIYLAHRRADLYPDPARFSPERWLGERKLDPYAFLPFGGGIRRCIGMAFALCEMKIILATVLNAASLRLLGGPEEAARRGVTLAPREGTRVVMDRAA